MDSSKTRVVTSAGKTLRKSVAELLDYRYLIRLLIRRDLVASFKQSVLGPIWFVLQPILLAIVYSMVFGLIAKMPTEGYPSFVFFFSGLAVWNGFSTILVKTSYTFMENIGLFGKVYIPRFAPPVAALAANTLLVLVQLVVLMAAAVYYQTQGAGFVFSYRIIFALLLLLDGLLISFGFGLLFAAMTVRFRDLIHALPFISSLWMYMSPVIYSSQSVPDVLRPFLSLNPLTGIIDNFRYLLLGMGQLNITSLLYGVAFSVVIVVFGAAMFNRAQRNFVDTI